MHSPWAPATPKSKCWLPNCPLLALASFHWHRLFTLPGIAFSSFTWLMLPTGSSQVFNPLDQTTGAPCSAQLTSTQFSTENMGESGWPPEMPELLLFALLGRAWARGAGSQENLPPTYNANFELLGPATKENGDLGSASPSTPGPQLQEYYRYLLHLENFSRPSFPPYFRWLAHLASAAHLFLDLPCLHISFNQWLPWTIHLAFVFSFLSKMLPTYCILCLLWHPCPPESASRYSSRGKMQSLLSIKEGTVLGWPVA